MNILIVHNFYKIPGGEDSVVKNEINLLRHYKHQVYFYHRTNEELDFLNKIEKLSMPFRTLFSIKTYNDIKKIIVEKNIDLVHVHNTVCMVSPSVYYAAFRLKIPVVQTIHNYRLICPSAILMRSGKLCDECIDKGLFHACKYSCYRNSKINTFALAFTQTLHKLIGTYKIVNYICLTEFNREQLLRINKKKQYIMDNRVFVKPNFSENDTNPIPYGERADQFVYMGRIDKTKGIKVLFEAWISIPSKLIVCGTGPEIEWCSDFIKSNNIKNIEMLGFLDNKEVLKIVRHSKAVILPTQLYEGFPMVLVESFSCGTPVIGSNIGNVGNIIKDGVNGLHFIYSSSEDLVKKVKQLNDMVYSTYNDYLKNYTPQKNYEMLLDIYEKSKV